MVPAQPAVQPTWFRSVLDLYGNDGHLDLPPNLPESVTEEDDHQLNGGVEQLIQKINANFGTSAGYRSLHHARLRHEVPLIQA